MASPFGILLKSLRQRNGLSQNRLARLAGIDPAYVNRLEHERADPASLPRRPVILALARALELGPVDTERLLVASGHCPLSIERLGRWEPTLGRVADVLGNASLTDDELAEFRELLRIATSRWGATA